MDAAVEKLLAQQIGEGKLLQRFKANTGKLGAAAITFETVNSRMDLLEKYWESMLTRHRNLASYEEEAIDQPYFANDLFSEYEAAYINAKADLTAKLTEILGNAGIAGPHVQTGPARPELQTTAKSLPKLQLPKFGGVQEEWDSFKEVFCSMVKDEATLMPVLKLQYLLSCLEGDAARRLANIEVIGCNFDLAWQALCRRYDNKRLRLSVQMNKMLSMAPISRKSVSEINRLLDITSQCKRALRTLGRPIEHWDDWFVQLLVFKLDSSTREDWEKSLEGSDNCPTYDQLVSFLENRVKTLDTAHCASSFMSQAKLPLLNKQPPKLKHKLSVHHNMSSSVAASQGQQLNSLEQTTSVGSLPTAVPAATKNRRAKQCTLCRGSHFIGYCGTFLQYNVESRRATVEQLGLCQNCLWSKHNATCPSKFRCRSCNQLHHTLLHLNSNTGSQLSDGMPSGSRSQPTAVSSTISDQLASHSTLFGRSTLLGTAVVTLQSKSGQMIEVRALIDPASEGCFIIESVVQSLHLVKEPRQVSISGTGGTIIAVAHHTITVALLSRMNSNFSLSFSAAVLPRLTALLPRHQIAIEAWPHIQGLSYADPTFHTPGAVQCILGADVYALIIMEGLRVGTPGSPIAQQTKLGWIITGPTHGLSGDNPPTSVMSHCSLVAHESISELLRRFWEIEEIPSCPALSAKEVECEQHFLGTHSRDKTGRYVVRLPFSENPLTASSRGLATSRMLQVERRLSRQPQLRDSYYKFMRDYELLGHMKRVPVEQAITPEPTCYLPHHGVLSKDGSKLRVVFDGSAGLNDYLQVGPKLQADITTVLSRWRLFRFAFTADIVKMFRQIGINKADWNWQRIFWRETAEHALSSFWLTTVTYGTSCAPYLAIRVLLQLAVDEGERFPIGALILRHHIYVDDAHYGADTVDEALTARDELVNILALAGMSLGKWSTNNPSLLPESATESQTEKPFDIQDAVSTLGLRWSPSSDEFHFKVQPTTSLSLITKRVILSEVARLYDPLGWLTPVLIKAKILLQDLWITGKEWDIPVDSSLQDKWWKFRHELSTLEKLRVPRWLGTLRSSMIRLHGFSDASEKAYAACVYLTATNSRGQVNSNLVIAKSKVAPIKTLSLPRLELCGALLLSQLVVHTLKDMRDDKPDVFCWTDSQVVLAWLNGAPNRWHTFVANRVSKILTLLPEACWSHVNTKENPADLPTRGISPHQLLSCELWWNGPVWLKEFDPSMTARHNECNTTLERKAHVFTLHTLTDDDQTEAIMTRFSTLRRLLRVIAHILRWTMNVVNRAKGPLSAVEIDRAKVSLIRRVQAVAFREEIHLLQAHKALPKRSRLRSLLPFLDEHEVLRVGGRLQNSFLPYQEKHPTLLPGHSHLSELLIRDAHQATLHGGPQLMESYLRRAFWIFGSRRRIRSLFRRCTRCIRFHATPVNQQMAPLPTERVTPSRPFAATGLDYAGPFPVRISSGRGIKTTKGYVCIFICMVTRATHIEIVSDYSTRTFLMAYERFVSRRGLPGIIHSDNGTNLTGAAAELQRLFEATSAFSSEISAAIANDGTRWSFIPPRTPHFGGLWEGAVRSFKYHLRRILGSATLSFEEFSTLAARMEACLNSRPLCPMSQLDSDVAALTPGHFLVGAALRAPPEPPTQDFNTAGLPRWRTIQLMRDHFWSRWRKEVLQQMQQRNKWLNERGVPRVGDLVLLTDDQQPPLHWPMARVEQLHPGPDGLTRVMTLRRGTSSLRRPLNRVILLPVDNEATAFYEKFSSSDPAGGVPSPDMAGGLPSPDLAGGLSRSDTAGGVVRLHPSQSEDVKKIV